MTRPFRLTLLKGVDFRQWQRDHAICDGITRLPYGVNTIEDQFVSIQYSDANHRFPWTSAPAQKLQKFIEHRTGHRIIRPLLTAGLMARSDAALAFFEIEGWVAAWLKGHGVPPYSSIPLAFLVCWLAERAKTFSPAQLAWHRQRLESVDLLMYFSKNQEIIFTGLLGMNPDRLRFVPFGIDHVFYHPMTPPQNQDFLAAGMDLGRDYRTLFEAIRGTEHHTRLICRDINISGLDVPANISKLGFLEHKAYRGQIAHCLAVVLPTHILEYPTGQSVLLESMAMAKCCIVTDTPAMRDYVEHNRNAILVPPHDPNALRKAMDRVASDANLRTRVGMAARRDVEERFNAPAMWKAVAGYLREMGGCRN